MALDLEAIRKKVQELSGIRRQSSIQQWKPDVGEHKIRVLPWKDANNGEICKELYFYYLPRQILSPKSFGKPDPIHDLMVKLYSTRDQKDKELANTLRPKMRCFVPIIVRGQEAQGVQVWAFGKLIYQRLLKFILDEDYGDITNPESGFDLKVTISKTQGKDYNDTIVDVKGRPCKLSDDAELSKKWLDTPNLMDMYTLKTTQEMESALNAWLNADVPEDKKEETSRGAKVKADDLDNIVNEIKEETKPKKTKKSAVEELNEVETKPAVKKTLDEAFDDLLGDDDNDE